LRVSACKFDVTKNPSLPDPSVTALDGGDDRGVLVIGMPQD
jgi:hypothetical protein